VRGNQARVKNVDLRHRSCTVVMHRCKSASPVRNVFNRSHGAIPDSSMAVGAKTVLRNPTSEPKETASVFVWTPCTILKISQSFLSE